MLAIVDGHTHMTIMNEQEQEQETFLVLLLLLLLKLWQRQSLFDEVTHERVSLVFEGVGDSELRHDDLR